MKLKNWEKDLEKETSSKEYKEDIKEYIDGFVTVTNSLNKSKQKD